MAKYAFWTRRRLTGITLMVGCFLFLGALGLIPRDAQGNFMVNLPLREQLLVIAAQTSLFQWSFSVIISVGSLSRFWDSPCSPCCSGTLLIAPSPPWL